MSSLNNPNSPPILESLPKVSRFPRLTLNWCILIFPHSRPKPALSRSDWRRISLVLKTQRGESFVCPLKREPLMGDGGHACLAVESIKGETTSECYRTEHIMVEIFCSGTRYTSRIFCPESRSVKLKPDQKHPSVHGWKNRKFWNKSMQEEFDGLESSCVCTKCELPQAREAVGGKSVCTANRTNLGNHSSKTLSLCPWILFERRQRLFSNFRCNDECGIHSISFDYDSKG